MPAASSATNCSPVGSSSSWTSLSVVRRSKSELMLSLAMRMSLPKSAGAIVAVFAYSTVYRRWAKSEWMSSISSSKPFWPRFCRSHATRSSKLIAGLAQHDRHDFGHEAVGFGSPRLLFAFEEELPFDRAVGAREDGAPIRAVARHADVEGAARRECGDAAAVGREIDVAFAADAQRVIAVGDAEVHLAVAEIPAHRPVAYCAGEKEQRDADQDDVVHGGAIAGDYARSRRKRGCRRRSRRAARRWRPV